jgi:hypothetical protein
VPSHQPAHREARQGVAGEEGARDQRQLREPGRADEEEQDRQHEQEPLLVVEPEQEQRERRDEAGADPGGGRERQEHTERRQRRERRAGAGGALHPRPEQDQRRDHQRVLHQRDADHQAPDRLEEALAPTEDLQHHEGGPGAQGERQVGGRQRLELEQHRERDRDRDDQKELQGGPEDRETTEGRDVATIDLGADHEDQERDRQEQSLARELLVQRRAGGAQGEAGEHGQRRRGQAGHRGQPEGDRGHRDDERERRHRIAASPTSASMSSAIRRPASTRDSMRKSTPTSRSSSAAERSRAYTAIGTPASRQR